MSRARAQTVLRNETYLGVKYFNAMRYIREYGNPIYDIQIRKVVKRDDGKYWNVPTEAYANVSQFWKYDPETYMKQPPYSREFQGIRKG